MRAKPFVKWAGGKGSLVDELNTMLPPDFDAYDRVTYIEPFVGGGAMLFNMLQTHKNIKRVVINDINRDLITTYRLVKTDPQRLIELTRRYEDVFFTLDTTGRRELYYQYRDLYNQGIVDENERAALFMFLNHTCYNGLYRVNAKGHFNVPYGKYVCPVICNEELIMEDHELLNSVECAILPPGSYQSVYKHIGTKGSNFVYIDPPYRPLKIDSSNFKEYSSEPFGDWQQIQLKFFCDRLSARGCRVMVSNSDSKNVDGSSFFETLYEGYNICRVEAPRCINSDGQGRRKMKEVLIRNY